MTLKQAQYLESVCPKPAIATFCLAIHFWNLNSKNSWILILSCVPFCRDETTAEFQQRLKSLLEVMMV